MSENKTLPDHYITFLSNERGAPRKSFHLDKASGRLRKGAPKDVAAKAFQAACWSYQSLGELRSYLLEARNDFGLVQHRNKHCAVDVEDLIDTRKRKADFEYSPGVVFDIDLSIDNRYGIQSASDVVAILAKAMPAVKETPYLWSYSSSSNIFAPDGMPVSTKLGFHIRFMTEAPWTHDDFKALMKRLVLAGYGEVKVAKNNNLYITTIFDHLTQQPNRWFFEAPPELHDGLYRPAGSDDFHLVDVGKLRQALPPISTLTEEEAERYAECEELLKMEQRQALGLCQPHGSQMRCKDRSGHAHLVPMQYVSDFFRSQEVDYFEPDMVVTTAEGRTLRVKDAKGKVEIYSPFREESHPSAFLARNKDGIPYVFDNALEKTFWPKPALLYSEVSVASTIRIDQPHLGDDLTYEPGITFVQSGVGTGKTTALRQYIIDRLDEGESVVYICHRESLARQVASTHGLAFYKDKRALSAKGLAICVDSVYKLLDTLRLFDHVIVDESDQLVRHLTGKTLGASGGRRSRRFEVLQYLAPLLRQAKSVVALDAHLSQLTKGFICAVRPDGSTREIVNNYKKYAGERIEIFDQGKALLGDFYTSVANGHKVALACDKKRIAQHSFAKLNEDLPERRGLLITADSVETTDPTAYNATADEIVANLDAALQHFDYFIYSPTIGTGYSIDRVTFDFIYGHFSYLIPSDNIQQLGRIRNAKGRKLYYQHSKSNLSPSTAVYLLENWITYSREILEILREHDVRLQRDDSLRPTLDTNDADFVRLYATVEYFEHHQKRKGHIRLTQLLREQGFEIDIIPDQARSADSSASVLEHGKKLTDEEYTNRLLQAPSISDHDARDLQLRTRRSSDEHYQLERHNIESFYGLSLDKELIEFDNRGEMRRAIEWFEALFMTEESLTNDDTRSARYDSSVNLKSKAVRKVMFQQICEFMYGFEDFEKMDKVIICNEDLLNNGFLDFCRQQEIDLKYAFKAKLTEDIYTQPVNYVRGVFSEFGIKLDRDQKRVSQLRREFGGLFLESFGISDNSKKIRILRVDRVHLKKMMDIVSYRKPSLLNRETVTSLISVA